MNPRPNVRSLSLLISLPALAAGSAFADLLTVHGGSLTQYRAGATGVQDVRPLAMQRGVNLDGTLREPAVQPWVLQANPGGEDHEWNQHLRQGDLRLDTLAYAATAVDLDLPAPGFSWTIARSYNPRQATSAGVHRDSAGPQGNNWFQMSQPELALYDADGNAATRGADDLVYLVYGADRYIEFKRSAENSDVFKAVNGAAGGLVFTTVSGVTLRGEQSEQPPKDSEEGPPEEPVDVYKVVVYYDGVGNKTEFLGFGDPKIDDDAEGQLWRITDTAGNVAAVGDPSDLGAALSVGYDADGRVLIAYDAAGRMYEYAYDANGRLESVEVLALTGGVWTATGHKVEYTYHTGADDHGSAGDLRTATVTTPTSDAGKDLRQVTYYRYYTGAYHAETNPGYPHGLKMVVGPEGTRRFDWADQQPDGDYLSAADAAIKAHSSVHLTYGASSEQQVRDAVFNGDCGCGGSGAGGTYTYAADLVNTGHSWQSGYDTPARFRTVVTPPDGAAFVTQYFDETGQPLSRVLSDGDPSAPAQFWAWMAERDSGGRLTKLCWPVNITGYNHASASFTSATDRGLVRLFGRKASGDLAGFPESVRYQEGNPGGGGTAYYERLTIYPATPASYTPVTGLTIVRPTIEAERLYVTATTDPDASGTYDQTSYAYTFHSGPASLMFKRVTTTHPVVTTDRNGSGTADTEDEYLRPDGTLAFRRAEDGIYSYEQLDAYGQTAAVVQDADLTAAYPTGDDPSGDFGIAEAAAAYLNIRTEYSYDSTGRLRDTTHPDGRVERRHYSKLDDGRAVTLTIPHYDAATTFSTGPVKYAVTNLAGMIEFDATVALAGGGTNVPPTNWVESGGGTPKDDPIDAITPSDKSRTVARLTTHLYSESGTRRTEVRVYHQVPAAGEGLHVTHYGRSTIGYDEAGRVNEVMDPTGTVRQVSFDVRGLPIEGRMGRYSPLRTSTSLIWVRGYDGGSSCSCGTGTGAGGGDGGGTGDGNATGSNCWMVVVERGASAATADHDLRGRTVVVRRAEAPHHVVVRDNLGRITAHAEYATSSISAAVDPTASSSPGRRSLEERYYDQRGRIWKRVLRKIQQDGAGEGNIIAGGELETTYWYDEAGRLIQERGRDWVKYTYDRAGRPTSRSTIMTSDDSSYAHAKNVTGDKLVEERRWAYDQGGNVLLEATIQRRHNDALTSGPLYTGSDPMVYDPTYLKGRLDLTAFWYDELDRQTTAGLYGTYGGATFNRSTITEPTASNATVLVERTTYGADGAVAALVDARGTVTSYEYDALGRVVTTTEDDGGLERVTRHEYAYLTDSLTGAWEPGYIHRIIADRPGTDDDQVTEYRYGTDYPIGTGHLLSEVKFPDSAGGSDVVTLEYDTGLRISAITDQAGNWVQIDYDYAGREISRTLLWVASGFAGSAGDSIQTEYDDLGRVKRLYQTNGYATTDDFQLTYDGWGNVETVVQDPDGPLGGGDDFTIAYEYERAVGGRRTTRRTSTALPGGVKVTYDYVVTVGNAVSLYSSLNSALSRVSRAKVGGTVVANYEYLGLGTVVGVHYPEPSAAYLRYSPSAPNAYQHMDRFGRVTKDLWQRKGKAVVNIYDADLSYDNGSDVKLLDEHFHPASFDGRFAFDALGRLVSAEEGDWNTATQLFNSTSRTEAWDLGITGNWIGHELDLNGDGDLLDAGDLDELNPDTGLGARFNRANEWLTRDTDADGTADIALSHDPVGNLTDDGTHRFVFDPFGRLREVRDQNDTLVVEYRVNALGYRTGMHYDVDGDGTVEDNADDPWSWFIYDEDWRMVAVAQGSSTTPTEVYVRHAAGLEGHGHATALDAIILRDRDTNGDGVREERTYFCQNAHGDVVALLKPGGGLIQQVRYSPYGVPFGLPAGDTDSDGDVDAADVAQVQAWIAGAQYDARGDLDLDGDVDSDDKAATSAASGTVLGRGVLSGFGPGGAGLRFGYAGYFWDHVTGIYHVRNRDYSAELGRFLSRDPLGYLLTLNLYEYVYGMPLRLIDPLGLYGIGDWWHDFKEGLKEVRDTWKEIINDPDPINKYRDWAGDDEAIDEVQDALAVCECIPGAEQIVAPINIGLDLIQGDCSGAGQTLVCSIVPGPGGGGGANPLRGINVPKVKPGVVPTPSPKRRPQVTPKQRKEVIDRDGTDCTYCGTPTRPDAGHPDSLEIDHKDSLKNGGPHDTCNMGPACRTCNRRKGSKNEDEFRKQLEREKKEGRKPGRRRR